MSATNIYSYSNHPSEFKPTYLYIKQHNKTGLKYFGKTVRDPSTYLGSGVYWKRHLTEHGNDITTLWYQQFNSIQEIELYAVDFSIKHDIVASSQWANLMVENGLDGGSPKGRSPSAATRKKISIAGKGRKHSKETIEKMIAAKTGKTRPSFSDEWKENIRKNHASTKPGFKKIISEEQKTQISQTLRNNAKPIYCITNNTWYNSVADAVDELHIPGVGISHCLAGRQRTTRGYSFSHNQCNL